MENKKENKNKESKKKSVVEKVKNNINEFAKEKLLEDYNKTIKHIDKLKKMLDNVDIETNANKLKLTELQERIKLLDDLKKQVF